MNAKRTIQIKPIAAAIAKFNPKLANMALRRVPGTNYKKASSGRKHRIDTPWGGTLYIAAPLTAGNSKLASNVLIFDLLAVFTCPNCRQCREACYAMKAQRQYPGCFNKRLIHSWLAQNDIETLESLIVRQLEKSKKPYVRIHSSGDFLSKDYADMWARIARRFPAIQFYTYTKSPWRPDGVANLNIVESIAPDGLPNFGELAEIQSRMTSIPGSYLCPYGVDEHKEPVHCGSTCTACMHCKHVFFKQH